MANCWAAAAEPILESNLLVLQRMDGSAQSLLVQDSTNRLWVMKLKSDLQGPNALANDMLGSCLCRAVGLPSPEARIIEATGFFCQNSQTDLKSGNGWKMPQVGTHFASRFFPDLNGTEVIEYLPPTLRRLLSNRTDCLGMFLFDVWARHKDRRQTLFFVGKDRRMHVTFIDHSHLFSGPDWTGDTHYVFGEFVERIALEQSKEEGALDHWIAVLQAQIPSALEAVISQIPPHWYAHNIRNLQQTYLARLSKLNLLASAAFELVDLRSAAAIAAERRVEEKPVRVITTRGAYHWM